MDDRIECVMRDQAAMEADRGNWNTLWSQVARIVRPETDYFNRIAVAPGEKRTEYQFDSTAASASERCSAALESEIAPRTQRWHSLSSDDPQYNEDPLWKRWFEQVTDVVFAARYSPFANFSGQFSRSCQSLVDFGTQALFIDEVVGRNLRYKSIHLSELYIAESFDGLVDKVHRKFELTTRQAVQQVGEDALPDGMKSVIEREPERKWQFVHCVKPNDENDPDAKQKPFVSYYIAVEGKKIVLAGGYFSMPYAVSRWASSDKEVFGRGPAIKALADMRMLNEQEKTILRAGHRAVDPPLLMQEDDALQAFRVRPNALNYGGVDANGRATVLPLQTGANLPLGLEMSDKKRQSINDAFYVTLFQVLVQNPQMTATEAMLRAQEKGALLAPMMGSQQSEWLGPLIARELDILSRAGQLPPPPAKISDISVKIEYTS